MAVLLGGKETADKIIEQVRKETQKLIVKPTLAVIAVGNDPASEVYVKRKDEDAKQAGINSFIIKMPESISQIQLELKIDEFNNEKNINAILVQFPLPKHINTFDIIQRIRPDKDVDGLHPLNVGKLQTGLEPYAIACTPLGIITLLEAYNIKVEGKHVVIVGRSNLVGKPLASLMLQKNATVTICHSKTQNIQNITSTADILVSAIGQPGLIKADWIKEGAVVIDVGINRNDEGKLCGDVDFEEVKAKASYITPVPGGVGLMTRAMLVFNTLNLYNLNKRK
ncbi:MAG: bifunctional 5,10-methylenetetrahydrofolate dehydrogenase/5,10-methenyltetrahydrofolate cyclohydrolase [Candidatus Gastranaerophilaceae bacterium]|jgi:methylenetetrahydrofolate dehydrogenase (NADP+)/methenyltetrahydrofolate cyclohydrolase